MSEKLNPGSGLGKGKMHGAKYQGAKRHGKPTKGNALDGISSPGIQRLARRGGVKRMVRKCVGEMRLNLRKFLEEAVRQSVLFVELSNQKTVTLKHVAYALKHMGRPLLIAGLEESAKPSSTTTTPKIKQILSDVPAAATAPAVDVVN